MLKGAGSCQRIVRGRGAACGESVRTREISEGGDPLTYSGAAFVSASLVQRPTRRSTRPIGIVSAMHDALSADF